MEPTFDKPTIIGALAEISRLDPNFNIFGVTNHQYKLNPPVPAAELDAFEAAWGVRLPDDYRYFVMEIGNGGAGPGYGLYPLGLEGIDKTTQLGPLRPAIAENLARPFPHAKRWNTDAPDYGDQEEVERRIEENEADYVKDDWVRGAFPISNQGCGIIIYLVVSGPQRGYLWVDDRESCGGIYSIGGDDSDPVSFSTWYSDWLSWSLSEAQKRARKAKKHKNREKA